jgi:hypothetical protein
MFATIFCRFRRTRGAFALALSATLLATFAVASLAVAQNLPAPPSVFLDTTYAPPTGGHVIAVGAGGDLQGALDAAQPGDIVELQAGATFTGNFVLPAKTGTQWVYIRSSAVASLPSPGTRVTPTLASLMPKIVSPNTMPAILSAFGAHHYRFVGIEITTTWAVRFANNQNLILFGFDPNGFPATTLDQLPHHMTFDRCYVHGTPTGNIVRGLAANSMTTAVVDSYFADFHDDGSDSQAIAAWGGPGPFKFVNNYLEGAAENLLLGGASPSIANVVPSDVEIRHNYFAKPLSWNTSDPSYAGIPWVVKNLLEFKNAQRVLVDGNVFEHVWPAAQAGFGIVFTVRNDGGTAPWTVVQDVAFTHNIVRHVGNGVNILGLDDNAVSQQAKRLLIRDNVFEDVVIPPDGAARLFQVLNQAADVTIDHNTAFQIGAIIVADSAPAATGFTFTNNIAPEGEGVTGTGTAPGLDTLNTFFPGFVYLRNVQPGGDAAVYPPDNFFPASLDDVGFVDMANGDYRLSTGSPFRNAGTDGKDIGADITAVTAATAGAVEGTSTSAPPPPPPPPPVITSTLSIRTPHDGAAVRGTVQVRAVGTAVATVKFTLNGTAIGPVFTAPPYGFRWDTRFVANGAYTLAAIGLDAANHAVASDTVSFMVENPLPAVRIKKPKPGATVKGQIDVAAAVTHPREVGSVQFQLDGNDIGAALTKPAYVITVDTEAVADGPHTLRAVVTTVAGVKVFSDPITVMVSNPLPTVQITSPKTGDTVKGKVQVKASLTERQKVTSLQFQLDGKNLGPVLTSGDTSVQWDADTATVGTHTLTAVITTTAGKQITSAPVVVTVAKKK